MTAFDLPFLDAHRELISVLRQTLRAPNDRAVDAVLTNIEATAAERLSDVFPPAWDDTEKSAYALAGVPLPEPEWDFPRIEDQHGIGALLFQLERKYKIVMRKRGSWTREDKRVLRWRPAALVLRYCAEIRARGLNDGNLNLLADALLGLHSRETEIGKKTTARSGARIRRTETQAVLEAMVRRLASMPAPSVSRAAALTFRIDKLGSSADANRQLWNRESLRKLGHQD